MLLIDHLLDVRLYQIVWNGVSNSTQVIQREFCVNKCNTIQIRQYNTCFDLFNTVASANTQWQVHHKYVITFLYLLILPLWDHCVCLVPKLFPLLSFFIFVVFCTSGPLCLKTWRNEDLIHNLMLVHYVVCDRPASLSYLCNTSNHCFSYLKLVVKLVIKPLKTVVAWGCYFSDQVPVKHTLIWSEWGVCSSLLSTHTHTLLSQILGMTSWW